MTTKLIKDVEQALGPVLVEHFFSKNCPKNFSTYVQQAARLAAIRFIRSQTNSINEAAKLLGTSVAAVRSGTHLLGYKEFQAIPKDEWVGKQIFYKKS